MKATQQRQKRRWRSYYGAEQKSLHVKMYFDVLEALDSEASVDGTPRNALINQACEYYCKQLDEERREASSHAAFECTPSLIMPDQVTVYLTGEAQKKLQHIASGMGFRPDQAAELLLERAVRDYDNRPFAYI